MSQPERPSVAAVLARIPLFAGVAEDKLAVLAGHVVARRVQQGERIVRAGEEGDSFFYILAGKVKVTRRLKTGEEAILTMLGPGEFFGEQALLDRQPRSATVYAVEATTMLVLLRDDLLKFLTADPSVAIQMIIRLSERIRRLNQQLEEAYMTELPQRLARRLLEHYEATARPGPDGAAAEKRMTLTQLAQLVGSPSDQVWHVLTTWQQRGLLRIGFEGEIEVLDAFAIGQMSRSG